MSYSHIHNRKRVKPSKPDVDIFISEDTVKSDRIKIIHTVHNRANR